MNIKYLKHYLNKCKEKAEHPSFVGLKNYKKYFKNEEDKLNENMGND